MEISLEQAAAQARRLVVGHVERRRIDPFPAGEERRGRGPHQKRGDLADRALQLLYPDL